MGANWSHQIPTILCACAIPDLRIMSHVLVIGSILVIKSQEQRDLGREGFILFLQVSYHSLIEVQEGTQSRNLETRTEAETREDHDY